MALGNLKVTLGLEANSYLVGLKDAQREASLFAKSFKPLQQTLNDFGGAARNVGLGMTAAVTAPLVAAGAFAVKTGIEFESAFAGVKKTVEATGPELEAIRQQFRDMAKEMPVSAVELARIGEAAGQLGISKEDIAGFTKQMAMLGATTNLSSDEAATAVAQFQNIFGAAGKDVDKLAATLVGLGNAGASTEKDIIDMGLRIAGAGNLVGLTQAKTLGFASALSSVGINAELGGSAISRAFLKMNDAVIKGGASLQQFATVAKMPADQFRELFRADPGEAMVRFLEGLKTSGPAANQVIESIMGKNIGLKTTLLAAAGAAGEVRKQVDLSTGAWNANSAAQEEYNKRVQTTESQLKILKQQLGDVGIDLFDALKPIINETVIPGLKSIVGVVAEVADGFTKLPQPVQKATIGVLGFAALAGPALAGLGFTLQGIAGAIPVLTKISSLAGGLSGIKGTLDALSLMKGVKSIGDIAAGLELVAASSALAKAGIWGLIGAITALGTYVTVFKPIQAFFNALPDPANLGRDVRRKLGFDTEADARLEKPPLPGVPGLPSDWMQRSGAGASTDVFARSAAGFGGVDAAAEEAARNAEMARKEFERFRESVVSLKQSLTDTTPPSKELVAAIHELDSAGQMSSSVILALGKDIDTLKNSKDPLIQQYVRAIPLIQLAARAHEMEAEGIRLVEEATKSLPEFDPSVLQLPPMEYPTEALPKGDIWGGQIRARADEAKKALEEERQEIVDLAATIGVLHNEGMSAVEIENALGISLEGVVERARELNVEIPGMVDGLSRSATVSRSWGESLGRVSDELVDMIVDFDFSFKRLGDIAKDTAKDMATSFLDGFFKPFKDQLENIGQKAGDWAAKMVFGANSASSQQQSQGGGWMDKIGIGGFGGGIFGGGNSPATPPIVGRPGGGMQMGTFGSFMAMNPMGMANEAVDFYNKTFGRIGAGRRSADEIVKSQESFVNQTLKNILDDDGLSATNKLKMVNNAWDAYRENLDRYSATAEPKNAITANQSFATLSPLVSQIQSDLMKEGAADAAGVGTGAQYGDVHINFNLPETVTDAQALIQYIKDNTEGIREEITRAVLTTAPALTAT